MNSHNVRTILIRWKTLLFGSVFESKLINSFVVVVFINIVVVVTLVINTFFFLFTVRIFCLLWMSMIQWNNENSIYRSQFPQTILNFNMTMYSKNKKPNWWTFHKTKKKILSFLCHLLWTNSKSEWQFQQLNSFYSSTKTPYFTRHQIHSQHVLRIFTRSRAQLNIYLRHRQYNSKICCQMSEKCLFGDCWLSRMLQLNCWLHSIAPTINQRR